MKGRKIIRKTAIGGLLVIVGLVGYYAWELYAATQYTIATILPQEKRADYPLPLSSRLELSTANNIPHATASVLHE